MIELDHRRGVDAHQNLIQAGDLRPVGILVAWGSHVQCRDRGLHSVGACPNQGLQRSFDPAQSLGHLRLVPARAILRFEHDGVAVRGGASVAPRIVEEHQRQQGIGVRAVRHDLDEQATEPDGLPAKLSADEIRP